MPTTYEIIIYGKVQHVGFRDKIENIGKILNIDGVVYNYKDGTVRILANFDSERKKNLFKELIRELEEVDKLIKIERIVEKELNAYIEFPKGINRISSDDLLELNKKLDEGVKYIKLIFGAQYLRASVAEKGLWQSQNSRLLEYIQEFPVRSHKYRY
jgi:acylphosphatase